MSKDDRIVHLPALLACVLMKIAAADRHSLHLQQNVLFTNLGNGKLTKLHRMWFLCVVDQTNHNYVFLTSLQDRQEYRGNTRVSIPCSSPVSEVAINNPILRPYV